MVRQHAIGVGAAAGVEEASDPQGSAVHELFDVVPTHTLPPRGARHEAARRMVWQWVTPLASVRQHRTASGRPQVERAAQATSCALHSSESVPLLTAASATPATQRAYWWCVFAVAQSHWLSAACRTAATALASAGLSPHAAKAPCARATRDRPAMIAPMVVRLSTNPRPPTSANLAGIRARWEHSMGLPLVLLRSVPGSSSLVAPRKASSRECAVSDRKRGPLTEPPRRCVACH